MPAADYWTASQSTDGLDPLNWSLGRVPYRDDDVYFDGGVTDADCLNAGVPTRLYNSLHLVNGYDGTVTFPAAMTVGTFKMASGHTSQPNGTEFWVTQFFNWTDGDINTSTNAGVLHLYGVQAYITPPTTHAVTTGDTLDYLAAASVGTQGQINPGTIDFINGVDLIVNDLCTLDIFSGTMPVVFQNARPQKLSTMRLKGGVTTMISMADGQEVNTVEFPVAITGGTLKIEAPVTAKVTGRVDGTGPSVSMSSGKLLIQHGAELNARNGVGMSGGILGTLERNHTDKKQPDAIITGDLSISGGDMWPMYESPNRLANGGGLMFGRLWVAGVVGWVGGTYHPCVRASTAETQDVWHSVGTFTIGSAAVIEPGLINDTTGDRNNFHPVANQSWTVIESDARVVVSEDLLPGFFIKDPPEVIFPQNWSWTTGGGPPVKWLAIVS